MPRNWKLVAQLHCDEYDGIQQIDTNIQLGRKIVDGEKERLNVRKYECIGGKNKINKRNCYQGQITLTLIMNYYELKFY